jgi:hypothetical protein
LAREGEDVLVGSNGFLAAFAHQPSPPNTRLGESPWRRAAELIDMPGCIVRHTMSHDRSGPMRRGFLGTATVATAATMAMPHASQAQTPSGPFVLTHSEAAKTDTGATNATPRDAEL